MSRRRLRLEAQPRRIVELYGKDLRWVDAEPGLRLDHDTAARLHDEGFTMASVRVGLWQTKQVSLIRWAQRNSAAR
ncbi:MULTISPECIES: hypothetical protein [Microbacterium]|uniref:hypothetical protein n=1 Tax=Microbacterium TaxID=33882 RepID=UPI00278AA8CC|nr:MULTISPECIES: hypothetical protein [Microbacterium]MDQ1083865.1 hypothetical protein [Microbacterium sp. SORGH_AS_0344]MDQ1170855.1 hypothetical protein [Microbacterium proteolyticum]